MKDRRGFTLIEIMIVIAIVAIGVTIATSNFLSWQSHYSGIGFQRELLSQISEARTRSAATSLQHRLLIDQGAETVILQRGNLGTASDNWVSTASQIVGTRGAGINDVVCTPVVAVPTNFALVFNPDGEVLVQTNPAATTASPVTQADIHISAASVADQTTIRLFGWTSKARLANGWS